MRTKDNGDADDDGGDNDIDNAIDKLFPVTK